MTALATSLDTAVLGEALRRQFAAASERARRAGRPVVASRAVAAPRALADHPVALIEPGSDPASAVEGTLRDLAALSAPEPPAPNGAARTLATEETPTPERWKAMVARAAADVRAGRFEKVVLARQLAVHAGAAFDP